MTYCGTVYTPRFNAVTDPSTIVAMIRHVGFGHLTSVVDGSVVSTPIPFLVDDQLTIVTAHLAKANSHRKQLDGAEVLLIVPGADGYVSPSWYPSKQVDGKAVPTWNYEVVHLRGRATVHTDPAWLHKMVSDLTDAHEAGVADDTSNAPWQVSDAPSEFIRKQLNAIVGVEISITEVTAKRKLSQNKSADDQAGIVAGLHARDTPQSAALADAMNHGTEPEGTTST